ncbi:hypothetical protein AAFF_G00378600 [Aldrovandia affinis]|uniref:WW-binding domain-containing protein n=1 Tax=Aldrovandia affinis TaxID=143900 RepID=A0AAD7SFJ3_9TELE|nr:hypothetical protein AAFF_G00378600 [Aldrovandia affinis]
MKKRRAEGSLHCDVPLKRCIRSLCQIDAQLPAMAVACGGNAGNPQSLPVLAENCRKRAYYSDDQELLEAARPRKKSTTGSASRVVENHVQGKVHVNHSGSFQEEKEEFPLSSLCGLSKKRMRDETDSSRDLLLQPGKGTSTEGDLCTFNSFQYWRVPLPKVDLSLLQTDDDAEELAQQPVKDSSVLSEIDAMET